jgi:hypothetical protein
VLRAIISRRLGLDRLVDAMFRPCPLGVIIAISVVIGVVHALALMPLPVILGTADYWSFPHGTVPGGVNDMAQALTGYRYLAAAPWMLPFLQVPNLAPPDGTNAFLMDAVPLAGLIGRLAGLVAGHPVNLLGGFLALCLVLPGVAMSLLFWRAGARGPIAAIVAACLVDFTPILLFEWGHISLTAHCLIILGLALCVPGRGHDGERRTQGAWLALLAVTLLIHIYLFVMVGALWFAYMAQAGIDRRLSPGRLVVEVLVTVSLIMLLGYAAGIVSSQINEGGTMQFGIFSVNLGSPFVPYLIGMRSQVMGYPGVGIELVVAGALIWRLRGRDGMAIAVWLRRHAVLIGVLIGCFVFALSNRVVLGSHTLLLVPLPDHLLFALGTFRASGRFVWPVVYAATAAGALTLMRQARRGLALAILLPACLLQMIDSFPIRDAIAASMTGPANVSFDRQQAADLIGKADAVSVFPTPGCLGQQVSETDDADRFRQLLAANVQLELLSSLRNLPLNGVYRSRGTTDCQAEARDLGAERRRGEAYFYLMGVAPKPGDPTNDACHPIGWMLACLEP